MRVQWDGNEIAMVLSEHGRAPLICGHVDGEKRVPSYHHEFPILYHFNSWYTSFISHCTPNKSLSIATPWAKSLPSPLIWRFNKVSYVMGVPPVLIHCRSRWPPLQCSTRNSPRRHFWSGALPSPSPYLVFRVISPLNSLDIQGKNPQQGRSSIKSIMAELGGWNGLCILCVDWFDVCQEWTRQRNHRIVSNVWISWKLVHPARIYDSMQLWALGHD